jgi:hypothetical protein
MAPDAAFDRAFVQDQIELHQTAIDALKTLSPAATNADVRSDVSATLPVVEKHLAAAQQLAAQLNKLADSAPKADAAPSKAADAPQKSDSASLKATATPPKADTASPKPDTSAAKPPVAKPPVAKPPV